MGGLAAERDAGALLTGFVGLTVAINTRSHDVYRILTSAAGSDPAAAELLTDYQRQRARGQAQIARALARARRAGARPASAMPPTSSTP